MRYISPSLAILLAIAPFSAQAEAPYESPALLSFGVGVADAIRTIRDKDDAESGVEFRLEYRGEPFYWKLRPWVGAQVDTEGSVYGGVGILVDVDYFYPFVITPSLGVGAYGEGGGRDLGSVLEFRSQLELGYAFENNTRVGLAISHISHADIGGDRNPGTESAVLYYHVPIGNLF